MVKNYLGKLSKLKTLLIIHISNFILFTLIESFRGNLNKNQK